jgi:hypothetical protein
MPVELVRIANSDALIRGTLSSEALVATDATQAIDASEDAGGLTHVATEVAEP